MLFLKSHMELLTVPIFPSACGFYPEFLSLLPVTYFEFLLQTASYEAPSLLEYSFVQLFSKIYISKPQTKN